MRPVDLDFPLCLDEAAGAAAKPAVLEAVRFLERESGELTFDAVILTGSFSRGEGSVLVADSECRILGDIEFMAIGRSPFDFPKARREMRRLGDRATKALREAGYQASVEYSPVGRSYLERSIKPSIFAFDLLRNGKTVTGDEALLESVPRFDRSSIPKEDAVRLVMNRIMEIYALGLRHGAERIEKAYLATKTALDLAGSVLAFDGCYVSPYGSRPAALRQLPSNPLAGSLQEIEDAVRMKLRPDEGELVRNALSLDEALERAMSVWRWEMQRLVGGGEDIRQLLRGFLAHEAKWQTLRGWAKYYTHPLRPANGAVSFWRHLRLLFRGSPQRLAYASALLAYEAEHSDPDFRREAARLLPHGREDRPLSEAIELWHWLVRNN